VYQYIRKSANILLEESTTLMSFRATDDLQGYLTDAVLPRLKIMRKSESMLHQRYHSRRTALALRPQYRNLSNIIDLDSAFDDLVNDCRPVSDMNVAYYNSYHSQGSRSMSQTAHSAWTTRTGVQARGLRCPPRLDSMFQSCYFLQHRILIGM
jgi:hypothetical protein